LPALLTDPGEAEAIDILQAHLDASTPLVVAGAAEAYRIHAQLPFVFRTAEGVEVIETGHELERDTLRVHGWLTSKGVTDFFRIARSARYVDHATIEGYHVTYALQGALQIVEPYTSRMILRRVDGIWKTSYAEHELSDGLYPGHDAHATHGLFSDSWANAPTLPTRDQTEALPLYQSRLDAICTALNRRDFAWLAAIYDLPFRLHLDTGDMEFETAEDLRRYHELLLSTRAEHDADPIDFRATSAVFLSDTRLLGYHQSALTRGTELLFGPMKARTILVERGGEWRVRSATASLSLSAVKAGRLELSGPIPTLRDIEKRMKK
jgi:hypothetical protein